MAQSAVEPPKPVEPYADRARPGRTPDRTMQKVKRTYSVVGPKAVFGLEPGTTGELTLTEGEATTLIQAGHIVPTEKDGE